MRRTLLDRPGWLATMLLLALAVTLALAFWPHAQAPVHAPASDTAQRGQQPPLPRDMQLIETPHYRIHSSATAAQTQEVAAAVESLHAAYRAFVGDSDFVTAASGKLQLVLYRDREQFRAHNRSSPWAEAYYLPPRCHAYYAEGSPNPLHWMLHEATHQLAREVSRFPRARWLDEGLASYFGASQLRDGRLLPGTIDPNAYPIWWLSEFALSGDLRADIADGRIIGLQQIISGEGGPDINLEFNRYYLHYWSLSHFLLQGADGRYAGGYRQLLREGGTLANFERLIGPVDDIQTQWYAHLRAMVERAQAGQIRDYRPAQ